jgi:release factor glutamine methyltransferase
MTHDEYEPAEDTFFIAEHVEKEKGTSALDVGSGSGYLTKLLSQNFSISYQTTFSKFFICCGDRHQFSGFKKPNLQNQ